MAEELRGAAGRSPMDSKYASTSSNRIALSATLPSSATLRGTSPSSAKPRAPGVKFASATRSPRRAASSLETSAWLASRAEAT